jgi:hypothetical protein
MRLEIAGFIGGFALCLTGCGGDSGGDSSGGPQKIDACSVLTQGDATTLFGQTAEQTSGAQVTDPNLLGECLWNWEDPTTYDSQGIQFRLWNGEKYYSEPTGAESFAIGDKGYVGTDAFDSVDIGWLQGTIAVDLVYTTGGPGIYKATTKKEETKTLALQVAAKIPK